MIPGTEEQHRALAKKAVVDVLLEYSWYELLTARNESSSLVPFRGMSESEFSEFVVRKWLKTVMSVQSVDEMHDEIRSPFISRLFTPVERTLAFAALMRFVSENPTAYVIGVLYREGGRFLRSAFSDEERAKCDRMLKAVLKNPERAVLLNEMLDDADGWLSDKSDLAAILRRVKTVVSKR